MITTALLLLKSSLFLSLHLSGSLSSFPKPLSAEEEQDYLARWAQGDLEARNVLIERNMRLVAHIIKKYYTQSAEQDDLISIGTIGLIKGISSYKPEKNVRLATYAARCIENAILPSSGYVSAPLYRGTAQGTAKLRTTWASWLASQCLFRRGGSGLRRSLFCFEIPVGHMGIVQIQYAEPVEIPGLPRLGLAAEVEDSGMLHDPGGVVLTGTG